MPTPASTGVLFSVDTGDRRSDVEAAPDASIFPDPIARPWRWQPVRRAAVSLVDQLTHHLAEQIDNHGLRPGMRLPSVRAMAEDIGVSRFTVVEAYDRLVARGLVQSRRGAGFYVAARPLLEPSTQRGDAPGTASDVPNKFDTTFVLRSMFRESAPGDMPGSTGLLPPAWLDQGMLRGAIRAVGRSNVDAMLGYGVPQGYKPLRQQIASTLQAQDVPAHPDRNVLTVSGVTHGLDLILRALVQPGDTVLVEDPAWFLVFGRLAALGLRVLGVPRRADGPDTEVLAQLATLHRPKLFIVNSAVHNPTGSTLSSGVAFDILRIAERTGMLLVEDDTYADFHPGRPVRLAALDRLNRVLLVGGYAKTLAAGLRVGYVAAHPALVERLIDLKLLAGLTSAQLGEQVVHRVLADGQYRHHVDRLRGRLDDARIRMLRQLAGLGLVVHHEPHAGMFVWADCGVDSEALARRAVPHGLLLAPGVLFSPQQAPSTMLRLSVPMMDQPETWEILTDLLRGRELPGRRERQV